MPISISPSIFADPETRCHRNAGVIALAQNGFPKAPTGFSVGSSSCRHGYQGAHSAVKLRLVGLMGPLGYNRANMDLVPFYRRPGVVGFIGLILITALYGVLFRAADFSAATRTMLSDAVLVIGMLALAAVLVFTAYLLLWTSEVENVLASLVRLLFLGGWTLSNLYVLLGAGSGAIRTLLVHADLAIITLLLTLMISAQMVLPVHDLSDRFAVFSRMLAFLIGERGPVTFIRTGKTIEAHGERERRGPGVFLIDYASAAVLRTATRFTRAVGPGIVFTERGEQLAEALDLRRQVRRVAGTTPTTGGAKEKGLTTMAVSRDGIPISTDISTTFMLDPGHQGEPHEGYSLDRPPYEFNPNAVEKAVYGHAYGEFEDLPWTELPMRLAADLWREMVKEYSLEALIGQNQAGTPRLQQVRERIKARLTGADSGRANLELDVLQARGIRILDLDAGSRIYLPEDVRKERMARWRESWAGAVHEALADAKEHVKLMRQQGDAKAHAALLRDLTTDLRRTLQEGGAPNRKETLRQLVDDAIQLCSQRGAVADGANLVIQLSTMMEEIDALDDDCIDPSNGSRA
jgi:hypothetical protein